MYTPENLARWKRPANYIGESWPEYYSAGVGRSRDSECIEQSNFATMLRDLGGESDTVIIVRENHFLVGWIEWIAIHESDTQALRVADENMRRLDAFPILDESDHSEREWAEAERVWVDCYRPHERAHYLRARGCRKGFRTLRAAVAGDWSAAAELLPSPTELIY